MLGGFLFEKIQGLHKKQGTKEQMAVHGYVYSCRF